MVTTTRRVTLAELEEQGGPEGSWEVIDGELVEMPSAGSRHSRLGMRIGRFLGNFTDAQNLGQVYGPDGGFVLATEPLQLRVPDVSFVRSERLPADFDNGRILRIAPDLAVEIRSPSDRTAAVLAKVVMWLEAGVEMVWLVDPVAESVTVYTPLASPQSVAGDQVLEGGDVLPGLALSVRDIFSR